MGTERHSDGLCRSITLSCNPTVGDLEKMLASDLMCDSSRWFVFKPDQTVDNIVVNIKDYIINEDATIIFWEDGTKTVVKKTKEDKFDKRLGLLIGYFQKNCGMSKTKANKFLDGLVVTEKKRKE